MDVRRWPFFFPRDVGYGLADLRGDVFGGITAGSIALPAAIGYGVISGLGPTAGLYGAVAVSFFAGVFGGTRGLISGPNILVTLVMAAVVAEYAASIEEAVTVAILAGLIQMAFGLLGLGRYALYLPSSLTSGFFSGFGVLLLIKQGLLALGSSPAGSAVDNLKSLPSAMADANYYALALAAICVALGLAWRGRLVRLAPAPFVVLVAGTVLGVLWFRDAPVIGNIPQSLPVPELPDISLEFLLRAVQPAFAMALLSSVSTLMVALHVDTITGTQHRPNRETMAQGIGNVAAGLVGGLPGGISPGTLVNAYSGGRTPVASVTVTALFLIVILVLAPVAERVPLAVLAGILIINGWSYIDWRSITRIHRIPRSFALVMLVTFCLILFVDINAAIVIGLVVAGLAGARRQETLEVKSLVSVPLLDRAVLEEADMEDDADPFQARTGLVVFPDRVTVASAREVGRIVRPDIRRQQVMVFDMSRTEYVDDSAAVIIGDLIRIATSLRGRAFIISGLTDDVADTLYSLGVLDRVPREHVVADMEEAKQIIRPLLQERKEAQ